MEICCAILLVRSIRAPVVRNMDGVATPPTSVVKAVSPVVLAILRQEVRIRFAIHDYQAMGACFATHDAAYAETFAITAVSVAKRLRVVRTIASRMLLTQKS